MGKLVLVALVWLVAITLTSGYGFLRIIYGSYPWPPEAYVHAAYYAVQTATTVGYGNWVPDELIPIREQFASTEPGRQQFLAAQGQLNKRIFQVKKMSIFAATVAGALFAFTIGAFVSWLTGFFRSEPRGF